MQIKKEGVLSAFYKVDLPLLWFLNGVGYHRCLVLACFADDSIFRNQVLDIFYCDNHLYSSYKNTNAGDDSGMPDWELYDIIIRHSLRYLKTNE